MADINMGYQGTQGPGVSFAVTAKTKQQWESGSQGVQGQIVFLPKEQAIFFDGHYYGISDADALLLSGLQTRVGTLEDEVGHTTGEVQTLTNASSNLAKALLSLKDTVGNQSLIGSQSLTEAISSLLAGVQGNQSAISTLDGAAVKSVNGQSPSAGAVTITGTHINLTADAGAQSLETAVTGLQSNKVQISSSDTTERTNSHITGASLTDTTSIATAIEAAHAAAVTADGKATTAQSTADGKISKSSVQSVTVGAQAVSNIDPSAFVDAEDIAQGIQAAIDQLAGTSTNWGQDEVQTLGKLRDLIAGLRSDIGAITGAQATDIQNKLTAIINELNAGNGDNESLAHTYIDKLMQLLQWSSTFGPQGVQGEQGGQGYYKVGNEYKNTLQEIINSLDNRIIAVGQQAGVISITGVQGVQSVDGLSAGNVTLRSTSDGLMTTALTQTDSHGAITAAGSTIQTAIQDVNTAAANAHTAADTADGKAVAAQNTANTAMEHLTWTIIPVDA